MEITELQKINCELKNSCGKVLNNKLVTTKTIVAD